LEYICRIIDPFFHWFVLLIHVKWIHYLYCLWCDNPCWHDEDVIVHPWTMHLWKYLVSSLYVLYRSSATWIGLHDDDHICISPIYRDFLLWDDFLVCAWCIVEFMHMLPHSCMLYSDQTYMQELVSGICVLDRVIW
jgi:hypothetical protein